MPNPKNMSARDRALYEQYKRKRRHAKRVRFAKARAYAFRILTLALASTAIIAAVTILFVLRDFRNAPEKYAYSLKVTLDGEVKKGLPLTVRDNTAYVSLSDLSELLDFRIMGDVDTMSAVFPNGDIAAFSVDTEVVTLNGLRRLMGKKSYFSGIDGDTFVPLYFFDNTFDGITFSGEKSGKHIDYTLDITSGFSIAFSKNDPTALPDMSHVSTYTPPSNAFLSDLSAYEKYMDPENPEEYLLLVNKANPLGKDYVPEDLIDVADTRKDRAAAKMREYAAKALEAMFIEMRAHGFTDVSVTSAYRSYAYQDQLFNSYLSQQLASYDYETAYIKTQTFSALPGTSEHQSGLCVDMHNLSSASQAFASQEVYTWLHAHCADFGFILRFPKDKQDITGFIFEPWH